MVYIYIIYYTNYNTLSLGHCFCLFPNITDYVIIRLLILLKVPVGVRYVFSLSSCTTRAQSCLHLISSLIEINDSRYVPTLVFRHRLLPLIHYIHSYTAPFLFILHCSNLTFQICFVFDVVSIPSCSHAHIATCSKEAIKFIMNHTDFISAHIIWHIV